MFWDEQNPFRNTDNDPDPVPLVVAVENCLVKVDFAFELQLDRVRRLFIRSKSRNLTDLLDPLNIKSLPFNGELARYLQTCDRDIILSSRLPEDYTREIARFLQVGSRLGGDEWSTDNAPEVQPLVGYNFSRTPFDYVGHSKGDLTIWKDARRKFAVWPSQPVWEQLLTLDPDSIKIARNKGQLRFWLRLINVKDLPWLITGPLMFVGLGYGLVNSTLISLSLFLTSISASILFDVLHLQADRLDPLRAMRPIASGMLGSKPAAAVAIVFAGLATLVGAAVNLWLVIPTLGLLLAITPLGPFRYKFTRTRKRRVILVMAISIYAVLVSPLIA